MQKQRFRFVCLFLVCLLPMLQACQTTEVQQRIVAPESMRISVDPVIASQLIVGEVNTSFTDGNLMLIQVTVGYSRSVPNILGIEYRVEWFDERGQVIPSVLSRYQAVQLQRGQPQNLRAVAPSERAVDFSLHIRPLRR
ncbi:MAG: YcfL family protein [Verrucomicrobia bacterium]|nr:YcfL family protein [Verrucomicrobiota bacterium]